MKPCVMYSEASDCEPEFVVAFQPVCASHAILLLREVLGPQADGRSSTAVPVMLAQRDPEPKGAA